MPWIETNRAEKRAGKSGKDSEKSSPRSKSALHWESSEAPRVLLKRRLQNDLVETSGRAVTFEKKQDDLLLIYLTSPRKTL